MSRFFYARLAVGNLKKNASLYLPYVLAAVGIGAMYYIMGAITRDEGIKEMRGSNELLMILGLGCGVIAIFTVIFLFYTNSFLMKRRKREFGLYNILGMEKRHIGKMMFWEILIVALVSIGGGLIVGIVLNKLVVLALMRLLEFDVPFGFSISKGAAISDVILFACIFAATLVYNLFQVQKASPIELLRSSSQGEREPKTRWILAVLGVLALGVGYGIAIVVESPIDVLLLFFLAVLLVMAGTYCLFTAGSIAILKLLRRNKNYYYKTSHFTSVSGMIYRMKQNAVGLSNICILSTMVLVMIAGTFSLYMGKDVSLRSRYPKEIMVSGHGMTENGKLLMQECAKQAAEDVGASVEDLTCLTSLSFAGYKEGEEVHIVGYQEGRPVPEGEIVMLEWMTQEEYRRFGGDAAELAEDEILVYTSHGDRGDSQYRLGGQTFRVREYLSELNLDDMQMEIVYDLYFIVVKDESVLQKIDNLQKSVYGERASSPETVVAFDIAEGEEQEIACRERISQLLEERNPEDKEGAARAESRAERKNDDMAIFGGFLFLGIFLGFVFLMATTMIIYYKQVSEGYEDKARFEIMQKVGMSKKEVRASIRSQIIKVFFLPLAMACIHLAAAFPMMNRLLLLFGMADVKLFAACTAVTVGIFAVIYAVVYSITAKTYYKIVN